MAEVLNDHIKMVSRNGAFKLVPIWQINQWIAAGMFSPKIPKGNKIGYDFVDHQAALNDMQASDMNEAQKRAAKTQGAGMPEPTNAGIAEVHFKAKMDSSPFSGAPPIPEPGKETLKKEAAPLAKPKDII